LWGDLGFPELSCLHSARQFVVSSPDLLGLARGNFSGNALQDQAAKKGFKSMTYRGVDMWFSNEKGVLSVARMNDQLIMIGDPKTLEMAVDRSLADSKTHSPLLARAAKFAQKDLWVVASQLPDDLANRFVPLDTEAQSFEGSLTVRNGLEMEAVLAARSQQEANTSADKLRGSVPTLPAIARGLEIGRGRFGSAHAGSESRTGDCSAAGARRGWGAGTNDQGGIAGTSGASRSG
jgi:hypothetical protein